jgi:hypothetical protein
LPFEESTQLECTRRRHTDGKNNDHFGDAVQFPGWADRTFVVPNGRGGKKGFHGMMAAHGHARGDSIYNELHGTKQPDEVYVDLDKMAIKIIEKKNQKDGGSVAEKLQSGMVKLAAYRQMYPNFDVQYVYCLSEWFRTNAKGELYILEKTCIPVFWGEEADYKSKMMAFICG